MSLKETAQKAALEAFKVEDKVVDAESGKATEKSKEAENACKTAEKPREAENVHKAAEKSKEAENVRKTAEKSKGTEGGYKNKEKQERDSIFSCSGVTGKHKYEKQSKPQKSSVSIDDKVVEILEIIAYAIVTALLLPIFLPLALQLFSGVLKTEFSIAMSNVSKSWVLITQVISIFICLKFNKFKSYIFMICVPVGLILVEIIIYLMLLIPIW